MTIWRTIIANVKAVVRNPLKIVYLSGFVLALAVMLFRVISKLPSREDCDPASLQQTFSRVPSDYSVRARSWHVSSKFGVEGKSVTGELGVNEPPADPDEARQWALENLDAAIRWLEEVTNSAQREAVVEAVCAKIAEADPAQAVTLAERYSPSGVYLLENLVLQWSERDEAAAMEYAMSKPAGEMRDRLLARIALTLAKKDPHAAADIVVEQIGSREIQSEAVMSVIHQWALQDPGRVLAWVRLFPEGELRVRALKEIEGIIRVSVNE